MTGVNLIGKKLEGIDAMKIPNVGFELTDEECSWYYNNTIHISLPKNHKLTDDEVIEFISDAITHEYIHHILRNLFSRTISYLFDAIGDKFRNIKLARKVARHTGRTLWTDGIADDGFKYLIDGYELDQKEVDKILLKGC